MKTLRACILCWILICLIAGGCRKRLPAVTDSGIDPNESEWIRVLLFGNLKECTVTVPGQLQVSCPQRNASVDYIQNGHELIASIRDGRLTIGDHEYAGPVELHSCRPEMFSVNQMPFRGRLTLIPSQDGQTFSAINTLLLEEYLFGVIGAEMQSYWEPQALAAQAVASRTYCLYIKHRFGAGRDYDLRRTQAHQVYGGIAAETAPTRQAVQNTLGQVIVCSSEEGTDRLFPAYYSSCCGGSTDDSAVIFGDDYPALKGTDCPYCRQTTRSDFYFWPPVTVTRQELTERILERYPDLQNLERIERVEAVRVAESERITSVRMTGSSGKTAYLRGEDFRLSVDPTGRHIRSAIFRISETDTGFEFTEGRGFGHGVGMCQSGAQALARMGFTYEAILDCYYPFSRLVRIDFSGKQ